MLVSVPSRHLNVWLPFNLIGFEETSVLQGNKPRLDTRLLDLVDSQGETLRPQYRGPCVRASEIVAYYQEAIEEHLLFGSQSVDGLTGANRFFQDAVRHQVHTPSDTLPTPYHQVLASPPSCR